MGSVRKRGDKWQAQVRKHGSAFSRTFLTKTDAAVWVRQTEAEIDRRGLPPDQRALKYVTLREVLQRYLDTVVIRKRSCEIESVILNAIMRTDFARLPLSQLTARHIAEYRDARLQTVRPVTLNRELGLLQHALDIAVREWNLPLAQNPIRAVSKPRRDAGRDRRLRAGEMERLLSACERCRNPYVAGLVCLAIETGMRQGELLRVRWTDLDLNARTIRIPVAKNGCPRTIPLSSKAVACFKALQLDNSESSEIVFPTTASSLKQAWKRLISRAGLIDLHFHDLRHEAVSRLFEKGLSLPEVALISGHKDPRMLFRYTHPRAEDVVKKLD